MKTVQIENSGPMSEAVGAYEGREYRVFDVAASNFGGFGGKMLFTREAGKAFRDTLLIGELAKVPAGGVLFADLRGVEIMDYSFSDETFGQLISRVARREFGERYLVILGDNYDLLENIEVSLRQHGLAMLRVDEIGADPEVMGNLEEHLIETLEAINESGPITTGQLAEKLGVAHTACNNRATNLVERGLVARRKEVGGRRYFYERIV